MPIVWIGRWVTPSGELMLLGTENIVSLREVVFCGMRIAESCQGVICGKFDADFSAE